MDQEHLNHAREAQIAYANSIGIDGELINTLVEEFYARTRKHPSLGPIFEQRVKDWDEHLYKLKHFWASVCLSSGTYTGRPMPVHLQITEVQQYHFSQWLELFEQTLNDVSPTKEATQYFMERANRIAHSFMLGMFYRPK